MNRVKTYFVWFIIYCFIGWVWEVLVTVVQTGELVNRGFLNGPYCPIYGTGAILVVALLGRVKNVAALFFASAVVTCTLEYFTSWAMEMIFHAKWWNYADDFMNINGRVCLIGAVSFGTLCVLLIKFIHPFVVKRTSPLPNLAISSLALVFFALILSDTVYTVTGFAKFEAKLKELSERVNLAIAPVTKQRETLSKKLNNPELYTKLRIPYAEIYERINSQENQSNQKPSDTLARLNDTEVYSKLHAPYVEIYEQVNSQERRLIKAFPEMRSVEYSEALLYLRNQVAHEKDQEQEEEKEKDIKENAS